MNIWLTMFGKQVFVWGLAVITTTFLFLVMKVMVTGQQYKIEDAFGGISVDFLRLERDEDINSKNRLERPARQEAEPPPPPPQLDSIDRPDIELSQFMDTGFEMELGLNLDAPIDGDALVIVRVLPRYPNRALSRGIEGWVLLEFAINELGRAVDPIIIDAEPANVFDRSAITAVKKWKYRPKIENGRAVIRPGVRQLISFDIIEE